jgi:L-ascorbate metabolism protein UlaG (beta-lactamase superfamily)
MAAALLATLVGVTGAGAQTRVDRCLAVSNAPAPTRFARAIPRLLPVTARERSIAAADKLEAYEARITFVGHSTFQIDSPAGVRIATDYNDYIRPVELPHIATMNRAHSTHYTDNPSPMIAHVLRGWNPLGGPARHQIEYQDVYVRNIATNTRWGDNGPGAYGNSIFIFQLAGMCIGHLGHLHHTLTPELLAQIGQLDVVLIPVDGAYTMDVAGMVEVMKALQARLIIPMHYFNQFTLGRFLDKVRSEWAVETSSSSTVVVSQSTLPREPTVLVLPGL